MIWFKGCPRCRGDMHNNHDMYGAYWECLQCGYMRDEENPKTTATREFKNQKPRKKNREKVMG